MLKRIDTYRWLVALLCLGLAGPGAGTYASERPAAHGVGTDAPDFALPAASGGNVRLSEHRGEVVVLAFWSSACGTCLSELAALDQLQQTYRPAGLVTLAVSVEDDVLRSARFAADHPAPGTGTASQRCRVRPTFASKARMMSNGWRSPRGGFFPRRSSC